MQQPPPPPPVIPAYPTPPTNPYLEPPRASKAMAIWALCLSWIPLLVPSLVAIGLGIAVLVRSRRDRLNHGKVMAIIAIVIGVIVGGFIGTAFVAGVIKGIREDDAASAHPTRVAGQSRVPLDDLRLGECFNASKNLLDETGADIPDEVDLVSCSGSHRYQVYASRILPDGSRNQTETRAENYCRVHRDAVLGPFQRDTYEPGFLYGSSLGTLQPTVQCLIYRHDLGLWSGNAVRKGGSTVPDGDLDSGPNTQT
jgi:hypothetical protein